mmetsp:Transcript_8547/g.25863  ORF Transcript_8547/g.25863 Transcript_8547/m.25863 type:complete len:263 (-) Transcript_8547:535-1323(-)
MERTTMPDFRLKLSYDHSASHPRSPSRHRSEVVGGSAKLGPVARLRNPCHVEHLSKLCTLKIRQQRQVIVACRLQVPRVLLQALAPQPLDDGARSALCSACRSSDLTGSLKPGLEQSPMPSVLDGQILEELGIELLALWALHHIRPHDLSDGVVALLNGPQVCQQLAGRTRGGEPVAEAAGAQVQASKSLLGRCEHSPSISGGGRRQTGGATFVHEPIHEGSLVALIGRADVFEELDVQHATPLRRNHVSFHYLGNAVVVLP